MSDDAEESISTSLQQLCSQSEGARRFFEWAGKRQNDANFTSIDVLERKSGMDRAWCIELAKELDRIGCGRYVVGRRGSKTRIDWDFGLKSIAQAALGGSVALEAIDEELAAELGESARPGRAARTELPPSDAGGITIAEAKRRLAISLGVPISAIEIVVRA